MPRTRRLPTLQRAGGCLASERTAPPLFRHLKMVSVAFVDPFKIPRAGHDLPIVFTCARPRIQKDERLHIDAFARRFSRSSSSESGVIQRCSSSIQILCRGHNCCGRLAVRGADVCITCGARLTENRLQFRKIGAQFFFR
jgi:hypothetical protein